jgi:LAO/AO transport system kinase
MTAYERRRLSRELSALANASVASALQHDEARNQACAIVGITGPPGVGKSTLIGSVALSRLRSTMAIVAIDPSSPLSGGAILGDRIRMVDLSEEPRIFIRSLATRASRDGMADNIPLILNRLASAGFGEILLESTGVGQVEYGIRAMVDTMVLVISPGAGDQIQAMKSGIVEIPDIFVVNKADLPGAIDLANEMRAIIRLREKSRRSWTPPVLLTSTEDKSTLTELNAAIDAHHKLVLSEGNRDVRARAWQIQLITSLIARRTAEALNTCDAEDFTLPVSKLYAKVAAAISATGDGSAPTRLRREHDG